MKRFLLPGAVLVALIGITIVGLEMGHKPVVQEIAGRITAVDLASRKRPAFTVKTDRGQILPIRIDLKRTLISKSGRTQEPSQLRTGDRVRIQAEVRRSRYLAKSIRIELPPPAKPAAKKPATRKKR